MSGNLIRVQLQHVSESSLSAIEIPFIQKLSIGDRRVRVCITWRKLEGLRYRGARFFVSYFRRKETVERGDLKTFAMPAYA